MLQCRWGLASLLSKQLRYLSPKSPFFLCGRDAWFSHWLWWRFSPWWCCLSPPAGIAQPVYAGLLLLSYLRSPVQMDSLCDSPIVLRSGLFRILSLDLMKSRHKRSKVRMYKGNEIFKVWIFHGLKNPPLTFSKKCPSTGGKKKTSIRCWCFDRFNSNRPTDRRQTLLYLQYAAGVRELTSSFFATLGFINLQNSFYSPVFT